MMDIRMPVLDGIKATRRLTESPTSARILVLTTYGLDEYVYEALRAGAAGFLLKTDPPDRIVDAVRIVDAGDALLGPETTRRLIERFLTSPPPHAPRPAALSTLTEREHEVLRQVARGLTNREIAASLFIGEGTVKTHVARILTKLGLRDRSRSSSTPTSTPSSSPAKATHQHPPGRSLPARRRQTPQRWPAHFYEPAAPLACTENSARLKLGRRPVATVATSAERTAQDIQLWTPRLISAGSKPAPLGDARLAGPDRGSRSV
jgi:DNA-binding NarL/FixJ family response regulator